MTRAGQGSQGASTSSVLAPSVGAAGGEAGSEAIWTRPFATLCSISFLEYASFYVLLPTLPVYLAEQGAGSWAIGMLLGIFSLSALVTRPFIGRLADLRGGRVVTLAGAALMATTSFLYGPITSIPIILGLRVSHGVAFALQGTGTLSQAAVLAPPRRRGEAFGYLGMFANLAMALGPGLGVLLMQALGFPLLTVISGLIGLSGFLVALALPRDKPTAPQPGAASALRAFFAPRFLPAALLIFSFAVTYAAVVSFVPLWAAQQGVGNSGLFFTLYAAVLIAGRPISGRLSDRFGRMATMVPGLLLSSAAMLALSLANGTGMLLLAAVVYGVAVALTQPTGMALLVDLAGPRERGVAAALFSASLDTGIGFGSLIWGGVADQVGLAGVYRFAALSPLLGLLVYFAARARGATRRGA